MKRLFEAEKKEEIKGGVDLLVERVEGFLLPKLGKNYACTFIDSEFLGTGVLLNIKNKETGKKIITIPWIRPMVFSSNMLKSLADYPRLNITKTLKKESEEGKVQIMYDKVKKMDLFFLIMLPRIGGKDLYWFGRYADIPIEYWKPTYRFKGVGTDRIHFPNYNKYDFVNLETFKEKLNKELL